MLQKLSVPVRLRKRNCFVVTVAAAARNNHLGHSAHRKLIWNAKIHSHNCNYFCRQSRHYAWIFWKSKSNMEIIEWSSHGRCLNWKFFYFRFNRYFPRWCRYYSCPKSTRIYQSLKRGKFIQKELSRYFFLQKFGFEY